MPKIPKKKNKAPLEIAIEFVLVFDGQNDHVELPPASIPSGNAITCSFWAYGGDALPKDNSVIEAWSANNHRILNVHLLWNNSCVYFDCGSTGAGFDSYDRLVKQINAADCKGKWSHWAFTKNATTGEMKIYLNGDLWHQEMGKTIPIPPAAHARLGSSLNGQFYPGKLAEVQLWNRARTQAEIQQNMSRRLIGDEPGLVSYWPLNEGEGAIANDLTDNANHGTIYGNPIWETSTLSLVDATPSQSENEAAPSSPKKDREMPQKLAIKYALTFDGQDDFITCPDGIVSSSYTKEAWVKLIEPLAPHNNILSGHDHALFMPNGGCLASGHNGQWGLVKDSSASPANTWVHVAVTYDSQTKVMCLYRDGHLVSQASDVPPFTPSDHALLIGSHLSSALFKGQIAEARVWNKVLSQTEIQSNLSHRLVGNEPGLVGYWPLNEGSGAIAHDKTNNANHGIIHGNPSWEPSTLSIVDATPSQPENKEVPSSPGTPTQTSHAPMITEIGPAGCAIAATAFAIQPKTGATASKIHSISLSSGWAVDKIQVQYENPATNPAETYDSEAFGGGGGSLNAFRLAPGDYLTSVSGTWGAQAPGYPREEIISLQFHTHQGNQSQVFGGGNAQKQVEPFTLVAPEGSEIIGLFGACGSHQNGLVRLGIYTRPVQSAKALTEMGSAVNLPTGSKIKLKSWKGDYLHRPDSPQGITTWNTGIGNEWTVEAIAGNKIKLKSWKGDYLHRPDSDRGLTTWNTGEGNEWTVEAIADNKIKLKSWKGDYLHRPDTQQGATTWDTGVGNEWGVEFETAVLQFDGQANYIEIPHHSVLGLTNNFTVEAWFNAKTLEGYQRIGSKFPGFGFGLVGSSLLFTTYWTLDYAATAQLTTGTWYHLAVVFDALNTAYFYLNGELVQTLAGELPATLANGALEIGRKADGRGEYFHGQLAEIRIWSKARTQAAIQAGKSYRLVGDEPNLVGYWPLNEGSGTTVQDKTSNANHGNIRGNVVWELSTLEVGAAELNAARAKVAEVIPQQIISPVQPGKEETTSTPEENIAGPAGTPGYLETPPAPIIIEMEPQTNQAVEEFFSQGDGPIYDSVHAALDQMKAQGTIPRKALPVFIVISGSVATTA